tara:strand:- start:4374 stop:5651 length:1278 start_codon:yes stop_codon:yes gene_type:complete
MRIIIILDSYKRDSLYCLKIAESIISKIETKYPKYRVFIVQTGSDIARVALSCKSSLVLHNYSRINNQKTIKKLFMAGVKNLVMDTEGFPSWIFSKNGIVSKKLLSNIDTYFTWGIEQKKYVNKIAKKNIAIECGSYRHQKIKKIELNKKNNCLILTSSPISNPGFSSKKESIISTKKASRLSDQELFVVVNEQEKIQERICKLLPYLSEIFELVLIRVHPFENQGVYEKYSKNFTNIRFSYNQDLKVDLEACSTVLHGYSTAGVEAYLSGRKTFVPERSSNLPVFLEKYFEIVSSGSEILRDTNIENLILKNNLDELSDNINTSNLNKFYGINKSAEKGLEIIINKILNVIHKKESFKIKKFIFRLSGLIYLQIRRFIGKDPKPNKIKSINIKDLIKIVKDENIKICISEINTNACIWEVKPKY